MATPIKPKAARRPTAAKAKPKSTTLKATKLKATKLKATKPKLKASTGGLTAAGRRHFAETEGAHLRPGVAGKADTPEKKVRKGSFLRRHFANPQGPMTDDEGEPTRLALSAHAWGEPVPHTPADAKKLAAKGTELLEAYRAAKGEKPKAAVERKPVAKAKVAAPRPRAKK